MGLSSSVPRLTNRLAMNFRISAFHLLAALLCLCPGLTCAAAADEAQRFATVWRLHGAVTASGPGQPTRALKAGEAVRVDDTLTAAANGEAVLKTIDDGLIALRPNTTLVVEKFSARRQPDDQLGLRLLKGSLRLITGWIGQTNPGGHTITTGDAVIGIRGTDHEPAVLTEPLAAEGGLPYPAGTYDKVNRGATTLSAAGQNLGIEPGQVGLARSAAGRLRTRALMTLLLPVLLDKVPGFYVPGRFDTELDRFSEKSHGPAKTAGKPSTLAAPSTPAGTAHAAPTGPGATDACLPDAVASSWLNALDSALARRDAPAVLELFAPDVRIRGQVLNSDGTHSTVELTAAEFVASTLASISQLQDYQQRRSAITVKATEPANPPVCGPLQVESLVVEQGRMAGKPYRFEASEHYRLEIRSGRWLAVSAEARQR